MVIAIRTLAIFAAALSLGVMAYAGDFSSIGLIALAAGFSAWLCTPYAIAWHAAGKLESDLIACVILALALVPTAGSGLYAYYITFINNTKPDAQDGLVFLILPLYQLGTMFLAWWFAAFVKRLRHG